MLTPNQVLWVEALRSGEFKQGRKVLHNLDTDCYCCLGIGCVVAMRAGVELEESAVSLDSDGMFANSSAAAKFRASIYSDNAHCLPEPVTKFLGLSDSAGGFAEGKKALAWLNDEGKSFDEIADIIESNPPGLFV